MSGTTYTILGAVGAAITAALGSFAGLHVDVPGWVIVLLTATGAGINFVTGKNNTGTDNQPLPPKV